MRTFPPDLEGMSDRAQAIPMMRATEPSQGGKSVASESLNGIDARGPSRWQIAGENRHCNEQKDHACIGSCIPGRGAEEERFNQPRRHSGRNGAGCDPGQRQAERIAEDIALHAPGTRSQSHSHTDLPAPLRHGVGDHAVNSQGRQQHAQPRECSHQQHEKLP